MHLQQIHSFLALSRELHFWNTAAKMNITQSALTRQIQALEQELGVLLFERNKRRVKLTDAGNFLREKWEIELSKIDFIHQFARQIHLGERGTLRIAHPDSISASIMPDILASIYKTFPHLQIELMQVLYENQQDFLKNYTIDLAITRDVNRLPGIQSKKIHTDHLALVVPEDHPYRSLEDLDPKSLSLQKFILPTIDEGSSYGAIIQQFFVSLDFVPNVYLYSEFGSTIIAMVQKRLGIAILPDSFLYHERQGLRFIPLPFQSDLYLNWRAEEHHPVLSNVLKIILQ